MFFFVFFVFFNVKILIFQIFKGLKQHKMSQNDKTFCLSHSIFQKPYIIWYSFMLLYKHFLQQKIPHNYKKFCLSHSTSQKPYIIWFWILVHRSKMIIPLQQVFSFFRLLSFGFFRGIRAKNDLKVPISVCFAPYLRNCRSYHRDIYRYISLYF